MIKWAVEVKEISEKNIKIYLHYLKASIAHICNLALSTVFFPPAFKAAVIKPIYKGMIESVSGITGPLQFYQPCLRSWHI